MKVKKTHDTVVILDFGSQYTQLIARRVREAKVYCEILPYNATTDKILDSNPLGIILSGGPASVYDQGAPGLPLALLERARCPMLGICYGLQLLVKELGGKVQPSPQREYGYARLSVVESGSDLFAGLPAEIDVWMSHGDQVSALPDGFRLTATTDSTLNATENVSKRLYGVQFHPEVAHTPLGMMIVNNFLFKICGVKPDWSPRAVIVEQVERIRETVGNAKVVCGLSGGVDSAVAAALVHQAVGDRLTCIFVDTGLLREGEFESTCNLFENSMDLNVLGIQAGERFLTRLSGVTDPEEKRKIIGNVFIEVFDDEAGKIGDVSFLAQGTLYPDVIESTSVNGPSAVIKSHHNVGGLPENMRLRLIEPLRDLFKDEAREIGRELGVPAEILNRHPFPGPGLAIRIIGEVKKEHLELLRSADRIVEEELKLANLYQTLWQAFPVLLPVATVGVMGDYRTYERVIALRAVSSIDGMTADWSRLPHEVLNRISTRLISEVRGINRVVYDITSKPPSTIEWE